MIPTLRRAVETGDHQISDLNLWRPDPSHIGAILCVDTCQTRILGD